MRSSGCFVCLPLMRIHGRWVSKSHKNCQTQDSAVPSWRQWGGHSLLLKYCALPTDQMKKICLLQFQSIFFHSLLSEIKRWILFVCHLLWDVMNWYDLWIYIAPCSPEDILGSQEIIKNQLKLEIIGWNFVLKFFFKEWIHFRIKNETGWI